MPSYQRSYLTIVAALLAALGLAAAGTAGATDLRCLGALQDDVCLEVNPTCPAPPPSTGLANTDWPVYQHDLQHTGKSALAGPKCNRVIWTKKLRGKILSAPSIGAVPPGQTQGVLYVPIYKYPICALNPSTGAAYWCDTDQPGKLPDRSTPALGNGSGLVVGTRDNDAWLINLPPPSASGATVAWRQKVCTDGDITPSPIIAPNGLIFFGSDSLSAGTIMAMCPGPTQRLKWCINPAGGALRNESPALNAAGDELYVTLNGTHVAAFNPSTGAEIWRIQLETQRNNFRSPNYTPVVNTATGRIYVGFDTGLWAIDETIDPFTGAKVPHSTLLYGTGTERVGSPPALDLARSRIYFGAARRTAPATFYAIDLAGHVQWQKSLGKTPFRNTPPVVDTNGNVYVAGYRKLHAFTSTGATLWELDLPEAIFAGLVLGKGRLYAGTSRGNVLAIGDCP